MRFGWRPDTYDARDWLITHPQVRQLIVTPGFQAAQKQARTQAVIIEPGTVPIRNQGDLGSCVAFGICRAVEVLEQTRLGRHQRKSPLFLYWNARDDSGLLEQGDTGLAIRDGIKSAATFGICSESLWPYSINRYQRQPSLKAFIQATNHQITHYIRLTSLEQIKAFLRVGLPVVFGFLCFESIDSVGRDGWVPMPKPRESNVGGHCVLAEGFDDSLKPPSYIGTQTPGAIIFANSWGQSWGDGGYGYLPYAYFASPLRALDFWVILTVELPQLLIAFS